MFRIYRIFYSLSCLKCFYLLLNKMSNHNILRVGTDCSGIEAPIMALKQLKIKNQITLY